MMWVARHGNEQHEVMHINDDGDVIGDGKCRRSPFRRYYELADQARLAAGLVRSSVTHLVRLSGPLETTDGKMSTVECGATGTLNVTDDFWQSTCKNCRRRFETDQNKSEGEQRMSTVTTDSGKTEKRNKITGGEKPAAPKKKNSKKTYGPHPCGCGCMEEVERHFLPGHDAKFHSAIKKVQTGKIKLAELSKQVRNGMFAGAKDNDKGVKPTVSEQEYLMSLIPKKGKE